MDGLRAVCFVDMPFGRKIDLASGTEINFNRVYAAAIEPAVRAAGLTPVRGDQEQTGGIIHLPMFGRLLLADYVVADLTLNNPNVYYELGIRHTARPFTTVPIFAAIHALPFDIGLVRAIPYALTDGNLTDEGAAALKDALQSRLQHAAQGAAQADSPLFQLLPGLPAIAFPPEIRAIFQDEVRSADAFRQRLDATFTLDSNEQRCKALAEVQASLGDLRTVAREILVDLMLQYRRANGWREMVSLIEAMPDALRQNTLVRQQLGMALNRRKEPGDRERAINVLQSIVDERGPDPETLGILGRVYKDEYLDFKKQGSLMADAALEQAIATYTKGFEADPRDYFPGVNAITLLVERGDEESLREAARLQPIVTFAVERQGGEKSNDYWVLASLLELRVLAGDWVKALRVLPRTLLRGDASWKLETTARNLSILEQARQRHGEPVSELRTILGHLEQRRQELDRKPA